MNYFYQLKSLERFYNDSVGQLKMEILNQKKPQNLIQVYQNLQNLIEKTINFNLYEFIYQFDYFKKFYELYYLVKSFDTEIQIFLIKLSSLIIFNIKKSEDVQKLLNLEGFGLFFNISFDFNLHSEIMDYYTNMVKSLIIKLDDNIDISKMEDIILTLISMNDSEDNLIKTTIRTCFLVLLKLKSESFKVIQEKGAFRYFFLQIINELRQYIIHLDEYIIGTQYKQIQDCLYFLQDTFQYISEIFTQTENSQLRTFILNGLVVGVLDDLISPVIFQDFEHTSSSLSISINTFLFIINQLFIDLNDPFIKNYIISFNYDNLEKRNRDLKQNFNKVLQKSEILEKYIYLLNTPLIIFPSNEENIIVNSDNKIIQILIQYLKCKDDNILLLSSNILIYLLTNCNVDVQQQQQIAQSIIELLDVEMSFRLITLQNLFQLISHIHSQNVKFNFDIEKGLYSLMQCQIQKLMKYLNDEQQLNYFIIQFRKIVNEVEGFYTYNTIKPISIVYLQLFFVVAQAWSKFQKKKVMFIYQMSFNLQERITYEINFFILLKNLRYRLFNESILMENEHFLKQIYDNSFAKIDNVNYYPNNIVEVDFQNDMIIKKLFQGGKTDQSDKIFIVALFGRDIILFQNLEQIKGNNFMIKEREYYSDISCQVNESNKKEMIILNQNTLNKYILGFQNSNNCQQSFMLFEDITLTFNHQERILISNKLEQLLTDCLSTK